MAGTVYATLEAKKPVSGARVEMTDASGKTFVVETNCAGNFFVRPETWRPQFPVKTKVSWGTQVMEMESAIHRESSCAACHMKTVSSSSAGAIYLWAEAGQVPENVPGGGCR